MGNTANCSSCGCGEKQDKNNTVHVDPNDPRFAPQPYSSSAPRPLSAAQPGSRRGSGSGDPADDGPPTDRKDQTLTAYQQEQLEKYNGSNGGFSGPGTNPLQQDQGLGGRVNYLEQEGLETRVDKLADGSVFEGQFRGKDRHGWGKFIWATGGSYEGQFDSNDMHGEGTYQWSDGSTYTGQWQRNNMGPKGIMRWTDGRKYEGQFRNGKKHGEGQLTWPDGRAYTGQWDSGKQHGYGTTVTGKGLSRKSQWEHGKLVRWLEERGTFHEPDVGGTPIRTGYLGGSAPKETEAAKGASPFTNFTPNS